VSVNVSVGTNQEERSRRGSGAPEQSTASRPSLGGRIRAGVADPFLDPSPSRMGDPFYDPFLQSRSSTISRSTPSEPTSQDQRRPTASQPERLSAQLLNERSGHSEAAVSHRSEGSQVENRRPSARGTRGRSEHETDAELASHGAGGFEPRRHMLGPALSTAGQESRRTPVSVDVEVVAAQAQRQQAVNSRGHVDVTLRPPQQIRQAPDLAAPQGFQASASTAAAAATSGLPVNAISPGVSRGPVQPSVGYHTVSAAAASSMSQRANALLGSPWPHASVQASPTPGPPGQRELLQPYTQPPSAPLQHLPASRIRESTGSTPTMAASRQAGPASASWPSDVKTTAGALQPSVGAPQEAKTSENDDEDAMCVVCMASPKTHAFVPCGHRCVCKDCGDAVVRGADAACPICRSASNCVMQIFT